MLAHMRPFLTWFSHRVSPDFEIRHTSSTASGCPSGTAKCPESLCPVDGVTSAGVVSMHPWKDITPSSSLIRTHASDHPLLTLSAQLYVSGLCRLLPVPAAKWPFPTLSLQVLPEMPRPLPRRFAGCTCLLLPLQHRPSPSDHWVGIPYDSAKATS